MSSTGSAASYTFRQARRASHAEGAGDSGLYRLIELHAFNAAGDAAVAAACAANTLAVAIPCHRVVRNDGALSGYRWGVERKRTLLDREAQA